MAILVIKWMRYLLPCVIGCVLIPASLCCMPCVLWLLTWLHIQQEPSAGARPEEIDNITTGMRSAVCLAVGELPPGELSPSWLDLRDSCRLAYRVEAFAVMLVCAA